MIKYEVSATTFEKMDEATQKLYSKQESGLYKLQVEGLPDYDSEVKLREKAESRVKELQTKIDQIDVKGYESQIEQLRSTHSKELSEALQKADKLKAGYEESVKKQTALSIAKEVSNSPNLITPHLMQSINVEIKDGASQVSFKNSKGSDVSREDFVKEVVANKDFSAIIVGSKASGSKGANEIPSFTNSDGSKKPFMQLSPEEKKALIEAKLKESE